MNTAIRLFLIFWSILLGLTSQAQTTLSYAATEFCKYAPTNPLPTVATPPGGTFSSSSPNLVVNPTTGEINLAASVVGGPYVVTYTQGGTADFSLFIIEPAPIVLSYPSANICMTPLPPVSQRQPNSVSPIGGTFSIAPAATDLTINPATGIISFSPATPQGVYTVTYTVDQAGCIGSQTFTLNLFQPVPNPTLSYPQTSYCQLEPNPSPTFSPSGGTFSATPAGLSINPSTGVINLSASSGGTYTVSYTVGNFCGNKTANFNLTIIPEPPTPTLSYPQTAYCKSDPNPTPTFSPSGGTFSASPAGLVINATTGVVDIAASATGTYTITYSVGTGLCTKTVNTTFTLNPNPVITTFTYPNTAYCQNDPNPTPTVNPTGGTFSAPTGVVINGTTGQIDLASSTPGTYNISYTITSSGCSTTQNFTLTINPAPANPTLSYPQTAYCVSDSPATPTFSPSGGTFTASPAGLSINASTGVVTPNTSTPNTYTITYTVTLGSCSKQTTFTLTINPNPVITTFTYPNTAYCQNDPNPTPTVNPTGGTFSAPTGVVINGTTGQIDLASSTPGTYNISYTITSSGCSTTQNFTLTINPAPANPTLSYPQTAYCVSDSPATPTFSPSGGTFTASPAGLSINASTGVVTPNTSTPNTYTITYTVTLGSCSKQTTFTLTINPNPVITTFTYPNTAYCQNDPNPTPTVNPTGGTFSAPTGVVINGTTGQIDLASSTPGTYNISYTITSSGCSTTQNFTLTINPLPPTPTLSYSQTSYCTTDANPSPTFSPAGGTFMASPVGLSINPSTGVINLSTSTPGSYTITYTLTNSCGTSSTTFALSVVATPPTPTVSYLQTSYCTTDPNPSPSVSQAGGTFTATPAGLSINASTGVINLSASTAGNYVVTYTLANGSCTSSGTFALSIVQTPSAPTVMNGTRCGAGSVTLTASGGTNGNYRWYQPDGVTLIAGEVNNTYQTPPLFVPATTYYVSIVNGSCESPRVPVQALVQLSPTTINITGIVTDVSTCNPANSGAIDISISGGTPPYTFSWSNGATTEDLNNITAGTYTVTVSDFFNCQSVATSFVVGTNITPLSITASATNTSLNEGESTTLSVSSSHNIVSYVWSPTTGLSDANSANPTATPTETTTYTITATDDRGCTATSQITIEVFGNEIFVPNAFAPESNDLKNKTFRIFGNGIAEISLRIFDRLGQVVYQTNSVSEASNTGWDGTFGGKQLPAGVFTWELKGKYLTGANLSYKGKNTGTLLLVR